MNQERLIFGLLCFGSGACLNGLIGLWTTRQYDKALKETRRVADLNHRMLQRLLDLATPEAIAVIQEEFMFELTVFHFEHDDGAEGTLA